MTAAAQHPPAGGLVYGSRSRRDWVGLLTTMAVLAVMAQGCSLMPVRRDRLVVMTLQSDLVPGPGYEGDPQDSAAAFRTEGLVVRLRYQSRQALNAEFAKESSGPVNLNPFTYGIRIDSDLGYIPDRFTVFDLEIINTGLAKVGFDPRQAKLTTDRGHRLAPWGSRKGSAARTFEEYYRAQRGAGGNEQEWFRQRLALAERSLWPQPTSLFRGQRHRAKLVFDVLDERVRQVSLRLDEVVVGYSAAGLPVVKLDLEFPLTVSLLGVE